MRMGIVEGAKWKGHLAVLCTSLLSSVNLPVSKFLMGSGMVSGTAVAQWRATIACCVFWVLGMLSEESRGEKVSLKDKGILLLGAAMGMSFNQMAFLVGFSEVSTIDASIIGSLIPVFTMLIAAVALGEPVSVRKVMGVGLGLFGGLLIIFSGLGGGLGTSTLWGIGLHTFAAVCYSSYLVLNRHIVNRLHPLTISRWMFLFAAILLIPFGAEDLAECELMRTGGNWEIWAGMLFVALGTTVIGYLLVPVSLKYIRPTTASMYNYMQPIVASGIAIYVGQDTLSFHKPIACLLIFCGVYLVTTSKSKAKNSEKECVC